MMIKLIFLLTILGLAATSKCPSGYYAEQNCEDPNPDDCIQCPANSTSQLYWSFWDTCSLSDCYCNPGFYGIDPTNCQECPIDTYSIYDSTECFPCPENSSNNRTASTSVTDCVCNYGHILCNYECYAYLNDSQFDWTVSSGYQWIFVQINPHGIPSNKGYSFSVSYTLGDITEYEYMYYPDYTTGYFIARLRGVTNGTDYTVTLHGLVCNGVEVVKASKNITFIAGPYEYYAGWATTPPPTSPPTIYSRSWTFSLGFAIVATTLPILACIVGFAIIAWYCSHKEIQKVKNQNQTQNQQIQLQNQHFVYVPMPEFQPQTETQPEHQNMVPNQQFVYIPVPAYPYAQPKE